MAREVARLSRGFSFRSEKSSEVARLSVGLFLKVAKSRACHASVSFGRAVAREVARLSRGFEFRTLRISGFSGSRAPVSRRFFFFVFFLIFREIKT